jgi:hypothetical protein
MTFERKIIIGLEEIKALVFQCNECGSRTTIPFERFAAIPRECPNGHHWDSVTKPEMIASAYIAFVLSLKMLRDPQYDKAARFKIFLELEESKSS